MKRLLLALALLLLLFPAATRADSGTTVTVDPFWSRLVTASASKGRHVVHVTGSGGGATWRWRGEVDVDDAGIVVNGAGTATVRVTRESGKIIVEVQGVAGVRITWQGSIT